MSESSPERFFDNLSQEYTAAIERCFPRYREMLSMLLRYLPTSHPYDRILELGCGTGNLSVLLTQMLPNAEFYFVDVSQESLEVCSRRLPSSRNVHYLRKDFRDLSDELPEMDLVISSISIHHIGSTDKQTLFQRCYQWLAPSGILMLADQFRGGTDEIYATHLEQWQQISLASGSSAEEFEMWMEHQRLHDYHDTLNDHLRWLSESGFEAVDCLWRYLLWGIIQATKPSNSLHTPTNEHHHSH